MFWGNQWLKSSWHWGLYPHPLSWSFSVVIPDLQVREQMGKAMISAPSFSQEGWCSTSPCLVWDAFSICEIHSLLALFVWADDIFISSCSQCILIKPSAENVCSWSLLGSEGNFGHGTKHFCIFVLFSVRRDKTAWTRSGSSLSHQHVLKPAFWLQIPFHGYPRSVQLLFFSLLFESLYFSPHK